MRSRACPDQSLSSDHAPPSGKNTAKNAITMRTRSPPWTMSGLRTANELSTRKSTKAESLDLTPTASVTVATKRTPSRATGRSGPSLSQ